MTTTAFVFPGQGTQTVGMFAELARAHVLVRETFEEASDALGRDLWALAQEGPQEEMDRTENTQPLVLTAGIAVWRLWQQQGGARPVVMAGHSLGEYTALTAAESIRFADAVPLVADRGRYMQEAVPAGKGAMAVLLGLEVDQVRAVCEQASSAGVVEAANLNTRTQVVIAGETAAVEHAMALAKEAGARRAMKLSVSVPSHCSLMNPVTERLSARFKGIEIAAPSIPVLHNASATSSATGGEVIQHLEEQLYSPVRWVEIVERMRADGVDFIVESGPGAVLGGLCKKIDKALRIDSIQNPDSLDMALEACNA